MRTRKGQRYRRNPTGTAVTSAVGGGALALFGTYKAYSNYQAAVSLLSK